MNIIEICSPDCMDHATIFVPPLGLYTTTNMMASSAKLIEVKGVSGKPVWDDGQTFITWIDLTAEEIDQILVTLPYVEKVTFAIKGTPSV